MQNTTAPWTQVSRSRSPSPSPAPGGEDPRGLFSVKSATLTKLPVHWMDSHTPWPCASLRAPIAGGLITLLVACSPALDWRAWRIPDTHLSLHWPCQPQAQSRQVLLAQVPVDLRAHACEAMGTQWALADTRMPMPAQVNPSLYGLLNTWTDAMTVHVLQEPQAAQVPGMTPFEQARQIQGWVRLPDQRWAWIAGVSFAYGTQVFRATVLWPRTTSVISNNLSPHATERPPETIMQAQSNFFASLALRP